MNTWLLLLAIGGWVAFAFEWITARALEDVCADKNGR